MADYALFGLKILLIFFVVYSLIKFYVFFFIKYERRRKLLDSSYNGETSATKVQDIFLLVMALILLGLLFISGGMQYISFITGLFVGMLLIQLYFHSFSKPLKTEESPEPPISPIKIMSYAIEASPGRAWKELVILTVILVWALYMLLTAGFGL
ncbi:hypothetical protein [Methanobacterium sp. SMA-27]|uniref:hypothetical protein n=1 Tax=Methanobacterium sp. SMA-27 TaxID=1495336 RepID=UPI00064F2E24|nr:hypothetical protein [Methanobacterium sp. SMA-27]